MIVGLIGGAVVVVLVVGVAGLGRTVGVGLVGRMNRNAGRGWGQGSLGPRMNGLGRVAVGVGNEFGSWRSSRSLRNSHYYFDS